MIAGEFDSRGKLVFEIGLVAADGDVIPVKAILDTGFTDWLAIDYQEAESLGWLVDPDPKVMQTAGGETEFKVYIGTVLLDGEQFAIPVIGGEELGDEILLGLPWLRTRRLVVDFPTGLLTLG